MDRLAAVYLLWSISDLYNSENLLTFIKELALASILFGKLHA